MNASLRNLTITQRLAIGFGLLIALSTITAVIVVMTMRGIKTEVTGIAETALPSVRLAGDIETDTLMYRILTNRHVLTDDNDEKDAIGKQCDALAASLKEMIKKLDQLMVTPEGQDLVEGIVPALDAYRGVALRIRKLSSAHQKAEALALLMGDGASVYATFEKAVNACVVFSERAARNGANKVENDVARNLKVTTALNIAAVVTAILMGIVIAGSINARLRRVSGDLSEGASQVASASGQVSSASQELAEGANQQAASLEETSASIEEMSSIAKRNADSAHQAKELSKKTRAAADAGVTQMDEMRRAMDEIKGSSNDISKIIKTIDEIAFQTNILALNAAVEAARAGEVGAGFAVVAEEVRALAQRSAQAARDTAAMIEGAIRKSDHGVNISGGVADALNDILENARQVDVLVAEIATASQEQNQGIGQLNIAVSQMDKVTQTNASVAEESAAAAEELNAQAQSMHGNVADLQRLVGGSRQRTVARPEARKIISPARTQSNGPATAGRRVDDADQTVRHHTTVAPETFFKD